MSLSQWFRDYVYFPLGGSRVKTRARLVFNLFVVWMLTGIWHGAGWTFLVWGGLHGLAQIVERAWGPRRERLPKALRWLMTFLFVNLAWVFFRAPSLGAAGGLLSAAVSGGAGLPLIALAVALSFLLSGYSSLYSEQVINYDKRAPGYLGKTSGELTHEK